MLFFIFLYKNEFLSSRGHNPKMKNIISFMAVAELNITKKNDNLYFCPNVQIFMNCEYSPCFIERRH